MATSQPRAYSKKSWQAVSKSLSAQKRSKHPVLATLHAEHLYMATLLKLATSNCNPCSMETIVSIRGCSTNPCTT